MNAVTALTVVQVLAVVVQVVTVAAPVAVVVAVWRVVARRPGQPQLPPPHEPIDAPPVPGLPPEGPR